MNKPNIRGVQEPPLTVANIRLLESKLGVSLPTDYRDFLLAYNGGDPEPADFSIYGFSGSDKGIVNTFFPVMEGSDDDLVHLKEVTYRDRVPAELLPIADDPGGNLICLAIAGPNKGKVYFWFHEEEGGKGGPPGYDNIYFLANSFSEFLDNLADFSKEEKGNGQP